MECPGSATINTITQPFPLHNHKVKAALKLTSQTNNNKTTALERSVINYCGEFKSSLRARPQLLQLFKRFSVLVLAFPYS